MELILLQFFREWRIVITAKRGVLCGLRTWSTYHSCIGEIFSYRIYWRGVHENYVKRGREFTFKEGTVRRLWPKFRFRQAKRILAGSSGQLISYWMRQWPGVRLSSGGSCLPEAESLWELSLEKNLLCLHGKPQANPIITQNILSKG